MRVVSLGINLFPESGGTFRATEDMDEAFQVSGTEHTIINVSTKECHELSNAVPNTALSIRKYFWPQGTENLAERLAGCDLIFLHGLFVRPFLQAAWWANARGVPYVVVPHGSLDPFVFTYRRFRKLAWMRLHGKRMLRQAALILFATKRERDKAVHVGDCRRAVLHWPVSNVPGTNKEVAAQHLRRELGLPSHQRLALYCGRLHPVKRPLETIRAFLQASSPDWTLVVVGGSSPELSIDQVRQCAAGAGDRVRVIGPVYGDSLHKYFRAAELLLLLSRKENFGYAVAEALSFGTPPVVSDQVDLSQQILEHECGFVVRCSSTNDLCRELYPIFRLDQDVLCKLGMRGRDWATQHLSKDSFNRKLLALSQSIVTSTDTTLPSDEQWQRDTCRS